MTHVAIYTSKLGAGLGLPTETRLLFDLWKPGDSVETLFTRALESGRFPNIAARRLKNIIREVFTPRYIQQEIPTECLQYLVRVVPTGEMNQLFLLLTARANLVLYDFIRQVYWPFYAAGKSTISNEDALRFIDDAIASGKTKSVWSNKVRRNVAGYLTGCCADYGLLEAGQKTVRQILRVQISPRTSTVLAYDLHFLGLGDNTLINHPDWECFGFQPSDVRNELKSLSTKGFLILQTAVDAIRIGWRFKNWEELIHVIAES